MSQGRNDVLVLACSGESKVQCCKKILHGKLGNVSSMNQGKLDDQRGQKLTSTS